MTEPEIQALKSHLRECLRLLHASKPDRPQELRLVVLEGLPPDTAYLVGGSTAECVAKLIGLKPKEPAP